MHANTSLSFDSDIHNPVSSRNELEAFIVDMQNIFYISYQNSDHGYEDNCLSRGSYSTTAAKLENGREICHTAKSVR